MPAVSELPPTRVILSPWVEMLIVLVALGVMAMIAILSIRRESVTFDETLHIPAGISYWQARDLRLNLEHPPMLKMWSTLPLAFRHVRADYRNPAWEGGVQEDFSRGVLEQWNSGLESIVFWARVPMLLVTLTLGFTIFYMTRQMAGPLGGLLALAFFISSPFFLGYGPLVLTDAGVTLFVLWSLWTFGLLWRSPSGASAAAFGVALAGALLSKFSAILLFPSFALAIAVFCFDEAMQSNAGLSIKGLLAPLRKRAAAMAGGFLGGLAIVYLFYAVAGWHGPASVVLASKVGYSPGRLGFLSQLLIFLQNHAVLDRIGSPVILYLSGMGRVFVGISRKTFILGHWYTKGRWFYFPALFLLKMTPGFLGAVLLLAILAGKHLFSRHLRERIVSTRKYEFLCLLIGLAVFAGAAIFSSLNIGVRHFMVPIAILTAFLAFAIPLLGELKNQALGRTLAIILAILAGSSFYSTFRAFPDYIAYFNGLIGMQPKYQISVDSNLDWGQSLLAVRAFSESHPGTLAIDYFGGVDPRLYVPSAVPWSCDTPLPKGTRWAIVTATPFVSRGGCQGLLSHPNWNLDGGSTLVFQTGR